ncbi:MAG: hypothetical protein H0T84_13740 [Tatlockia sp.]|nr:hypothetical protein [Tatlockia sp.]
MNTRLVWNFEITNSDLVNFDDLKESKEEIRWEARYFWPEDAIISLNGLDSRFLDLSNYEVKQRQDCYSLLIDSNYNIKQRRSQLFYKPLLQETDLLRGYGKKINLENYPSELILPGSKLRAAEIVKQLENNQQKIEVAKEALIYKMPSEPTIKLELARMEIFRNIYFSLCVEGRSQNLVATLARQLMPGGHSCDYVSFLKRILALC